MPMSAHAPLSPEQLQRRVAILQAMAVLDTPPEEGFDAISRLAARVCDVPIAIVSLIDGDRLWFKSAYGVSATTIPSHQSFCCECASGATVLEVADARIDPRFATNGLVSGDLGIQYYAGAPIFSHGIAVGTVCVLDKVPRSLRPYALQALEDLATLARALLTARIEAFGMLATTTRR